MPKLRVAYVSLFVLVACGGSGDTGSTSGDDSAVGDDTLVTSDTEGRDTTSGSDTASGTDTTGTDTIGIDTAKGDTVATDAPSDTAIGPYPAGPYSANEGDTITNLAWIGYVNDAADAVADTKPYVDYSLDDARRTGRKYLLLHVSDFA